MHGVVHGVPDSAKQRPDEARLKPWSAEEVLSFVDDVLRMPARCKGAVVVSHHEVFYLWRDALRKKTLTAPFFLCHVDAHADLGQGFPRALHYLLDDFVNLPLERRASPKRGSAGINFGSFMAFALGNRWFESIDFIASESWNEDISPFLLAPRTYQDLLRAKKPLTPPASLDLQLMHLPRTYWSRPKITSPEERRESGEPIVRLNLLDAKSAVGRYDRIAWDFVYLCHSPGYVPASADHLLELLRARIQPQ